MQGVDAYIICLGVVYIFRHSHDKNRRESLAKSMLAWENVNRKGGISRLPSMPPQSAAGKDPQRHGGYQHPSVLPRLQTRDHNRHIERPVL